MLIAYLFAPYTCPQMHVQFRVVFPRLLRPFYAVVQIHVSV